MTRQNKMLRIIARPMRFLIVKHENVAQATSNIFFVSFHGWKIDAKDDVVRVDFRTEFVVEEVARGTDNGARVVDATEERFVDEIVVCGELGCVVVKIVVVASVV